MCFEYEIGTQLRLYIKHCTQLSLCTVGKEEPRAL